MKPARGNVTGDKQAAPRRQTTAGTSGQQESKTSRRRPAAGNVDKQQTGATSAAGLSKRGERGVGAVAAAGGSLIKGQETLGDGGAKTKPTRNSGAQGNVIDLDQQQASCSSTTTTNAAASTIEKRHHQREPSSPPTTRAADSKQQPATEAKRRQQIFKELSRGQSEDTSSSSQEMTTTASSMRSDVTLTPMQGGNVVFEQETNVDGLEMGDSCAAGGDNTDDDECTTLLETPKSTAGARKNQSIVAPIRNTDLTMLKTEANSGASGSQEPEIVLYHDDEEINFVCSPSSEAAPPLRLHEPPRRGPSTDTDEYEEDDFNEFSHGAALTMADDDQLTTEHGEDISFVVHPLGCCDFDETQLVSSTSTRAIQKCILKLMSLESDQEETTCWGLGQTQPILMRLLEDHIQFTDLTSRHLLRSLPIHTIKSWAVDDDNNFAFVNEDNQRGNYSQAAGDVDASVDSTIDYALLNGPTFKCYVFRSFDDDDDMSCRVAAKLNEQIARHREQLASRAANEAKCRLQQMIVVEPKELVPTNPLDDMTDLDAEDLDELEQLDNANELSMNVKYIGKVQVPRPNGIDVANAAIDTCLANASSRLSGPSNPDDGPSSQNSSPTPQTASSPLINARLHVSPSSVIVENVETGSIIVECRIRFLTFIAISRRDIRWCSFIMQNTTNKTFVAHCFECHPTAGHVCEAIQASCSRMYEKMLRGQKSKRQQQQDATTSIMPNGSKIRDTLAKTLSRIKLAPIR